MSEGNISLENNLDVVLFILFCVRRLCSEGQFRGSPKLASVLRGTQAMSLVEDFFHTLT